MCRNGNIIKQKQQNLQQNIQQNLQQNIQQGQVQTDLSFEGGMVIYDNEMQQVLNPQVVNPQMAGQQTPLQKHITELKSDQRILLQAHEMYSPYNIHDEYEKYINPRVSFKGELPDIRINNIKESNLNNLTEAYGRTGFELTDSVEKRTKMLKQCRERKVIQQRFAQKLENAAPVEEYRNLTLKEAMKLSDKKLVDNYGTDYSGAGKEYIDIRYNLMKNPLYSLLPVDELKKKSRYELLNKLNKEYSRGDAETSRKDVIALYTDLIKLQILEKKESKVERKNPKNPPVNITAKEIKDNRSTLVNVTSAVHRYNHLTSNEKTDRWNAASRVLESGAFKFWDDKTDADMDGVSPAQQEGARMVLAWMYRNCGVGKSGSKEPFVYSLTQAKPKQLLFILYLVENGLTTSPNAECFDDALKNYIPDPKSKAFKGKPDWTAIGQAAGFVDKCEEFNEYLNCQNEEYSIKQDLKKYKKLEAEGEHHPRERWEAKAKLAVVLTNKLVAMYNAAGLAVDMPAALIADETLKQHIWETATAINDVLSDLKDDLNNPDYQDAAQEARIERMLSEGYYGEEGEGGAPVQGKKSAKLDNKDTEVPGKTLVQETAKYVKAGADLPQTVIKSFGKTTENITKALPYAVATNGLGSVFALITLVFKSNDLYKLLKSIAKGTNTLSFAETASKTLDLSGTTIKGGADLVKSGVEIYKNANNLNGKEFANLADKLSSTPEAIQFGTGVISILAGGLQTTSAVIDLKEVSYSRKHLNKAQQHLDNKTREDDQQNLTVGQMKQKELQRKELQLLLKHRQEMTTNTRNSALVNMTGGILTMAGGALSVTGILAPLGGILGIAGSAISIGLGIVHARAARRKSIKDAVDEGLRLTDAIREVRRYFNIKKITTSEYEVLEDQVRQEALAELHYVDYKVCYVDMCRKSASLLYNKVLEKPSEPGNEGYTDTEEYKMYYETLASLGFKEIKRAEYPFQRNIPTAVQIYDKLAKGVSQ